MAYFYTALYNGDIAGGPLRAICTRVGEDGNLNQIPAKENTYDSPASKSYVEPSRAEKSLPNAVSPRLQNRFNRKITRRLVMAQLLSGASHKALSDQDIALIKKECFELLSAGDLQSSPAWENALFIMLSLVTGRSTSFLRSLKVKPQTAKGFPSEPCWAILDFRYCLYDVPNIPRGSRPDMIGERNANEALPQKKTAGVFIHIPDELAEGLVRLHNRFSPKKTRLPETESQTLSAFASLKDRNVSPAKIQAHLALSLKHQGVDDVIAGYVSGKTADQLPAMYYTQVSQADITAAHSNYLVGLGFAPSPAMPDDQKIGSMLVPTPEWTGELFNYMRTQIAKVDTGKREDLFNHHNYLMFYTYLVLCLSTGHRPVKAPFQYLRDFDLTSGFVWISDKVVRTNHASRVVPLCDTALQQMRYYVEHLRRLRDRLRHTDYETSSYIENALRSVNPVLFVFDEEGKSFLTPKILQSWHGFISALPGNWNRHTLRSLLTNAVPYNCLNAFMGHALIGIGPLSGTSGFEFASLRSLNCHLEQILQRYGAIALADTPQHYVIEPYEPAGNHTAHVGRNGRAKDRAHLLKRAVEKCDEIQNEVGFCREKITTAEDYEVALAEAENQLHALNLSAEQYCRAKSHLQKRAKEIIDAHGIAVSLPSVPAQVSFEPSFRTEKWFTLARYIHAWDKAFYERLEEFGRSSQEDDLTLIGLILYAATTRGGLANAKLLADLAVQLSDHTVKPQTMGPYVWFDLDIPIDGKEGRYSLKVGNKCHQHRHWFVDEVSLALIIRLYKKRSPNSDVPLGKARLLKANVFDLIKKAIFGEDTNQTPITDLEKLTSAALWRHDSIAGPGISEALQSLASGRFQTFSIDRQAWIGLFNDIPVATHMPASVSYKADERKAPSRYRAEDPHVWGSFYENHLIPALRPVLQNHTKVKISEVLVNLEALKETEDLPTHLHLALDWLIDVGKRGDKPSTLQRYCSAFVSVWLLETHGRIPDLHDAEELEELYGNLLTYHDSPSEVAYMLGRMADFHAFGMRDSRYRLPQIENQQWHQFKRHSLVRTKVLSFRQVQAAIDLMTSGEPSARERRKISLFVMLAYRTGMRLTELVKLQLKDVEISKDCVISIRDNQFGNNKSRAGRRQINLGVFLDDREMGEFKSLMAQYARKTNRNLPVFSFGSTGAPYHGGQISKMFSQAIEQVTGDADVVFHSLRHSCLSCLHATLEGEAEIAHMIAGLSVEKMEAIREHLVGHIGNRMGLYYTLAAFAGHAGPRETMLSYLHLSDLIIFSKLQRQRLEIGTDKLAQIAGVQGSKIADLDSNERHQYLVRHKVPAIASSYPFVLPAEQKPSSSGTEEGHTTQAKHDLMLVDEILRALQEGSKARDLAFQYDVDREVIEKWHQKAIELQSLKTRRGNSRLFGKDKEASIRLRARNDNRVKAELDRVCRGMHAKLDCWSAEEIERFMKAILLASSPDARSYRIHDPIFAAEIVEFFLPEIPVGRWRMEIDIPEGPDFKASRDRWKLHNPWLSESDFKSRPQKISAHHQDGIGLLRLTHPAKSDNSSLPKLVAYLVSVSYDEAD
ncbi:tyrosine-type recombinase/integrase [Kordiimonas lipolytica]|uniref:Tyrosine-type recombinase/integrase n=1 Tax=Kordiimonas lipolytica TaxID=1662421 RepID=A0ABV8UD81_9PROT